MAILRIIVNINVDTARVDPWEAADWIFDPDISVEVIEAEWQGEEE